MYMCHPWYTPYTQCTLHSWNMCIMLNTRMPLIEHMCACICVWDDREQLIPLHMYNCSNQNHMKLICVSFTALRLSFWVRGLMRASKRFGCLIWQTSLKCCQWWGKRFYTVSNGIILCSVGVRCSLKRNTLFSYSYVCISNEKLNTFVCWNCKICLCGVWRKMSTSKNWQGW